MCSVIMHEEETIHFYVYLVIFKAQNFKSTNSVYVFEIITTHFGKQRLETHFFLVYERKIRDFSCPFFCYSFCCDSD